MKFTDLELIVVLSEEGTMSKASERLFVSQPALSQRLHAIESEWNAKLFVRSRRGVMLTAEGERIKEFACSTLEKMAETRAELLAHASEIYGTLKLAVSSVNGQYWLPNVLKTFVDEYPHVRISLTTGWSSGVLEQIYRGECQAAIVRGTPNWSGGKLHLFSDPLQFVDSKITRLEELNLDDRPYVQFRSDSSYDQVIQNWWHSQNLRPPSRTIMVDQIETCKQMVTHGIGYAVLPSISLTEQDRVQRIPLKDHQGKAIVRDNWLLYDQKAKRLKQVHAFIELVKRGLFS
ncbi:LysR family transcriptional regulator [Sporolactobacillus terrae]|uniref:LysR family transcriptional regulator n=1 Tax=Sporolactobacillus terrae TaxID=269673 RepID=A0A410D810_9BACL|nr:LysR family transcriptional regulator [Sporolactobacillus terrae]QAA22214.1 LysR family transcriptional regulator [Sporolactobacillus terrae]QAA25188.1 LysR family transcriptional regulator [Sporolactobacillus terrae]UAK17004.1 LysR family transcriptional regulator [Sporolactobacillus terrae]BBN98525.1 putative HTH-type transcriptional regulator YkuM [Sporolactobacillus terrae]